MSSFKTRALRIFLSIFFCIDLCIFYKIQCKKKYYTELSKNSQSSYFMSDEVISHLYMPFKYFQVL